MRDAGRARVTRHHGRLILCAWLAGVVAVAAHLRASDNQAQTATPSLEVLWQYDTGG
jgi:hypothetical protein